MEKKRVEIFRPFPPKKPVEIGIDPTDAGELQKIIDKFGGEVIVDLKKDGFNAAIHKKGDEVKAYTSGMNEYELETFPELLHDLGLLDDGIYIGEIHGRENKENYTNRDAFEAMQKRGRGKKGKELGKLVEKYPLTLNLYDIYVYEGEELLDVPQRERRKVLEDIVSKKDFDNTDVVGSFTITTPQELQELYEKHVASGKEEGFVLKDPRCTVKTKVKDGQLELLRTDDWIKMKRFSTFDLIVLGFYETENSKGKGLPYASVLLGTLNEDTGKYETVVKLPVGKGAEGYYELFEQLEDNLGDFDPEDYDGEISYSPLMLSKRDKMPDKIVLDVSKSPVVQVRAMGVNKSKSGWHSCGMDEGESYSLRIAVYEHIRKDKNAKDANTAGFIKRFYEGLGENN